MVSQRVNPEKAPPTVTDANANPEGEIGNTGKIRTIWSLALTGFYILFLILMNSFYRCNCVEIVKSVHCLRRSIIKKYQHIHFHLVHNESRGFWVGGIAGSPVKKQDLDWKFKLPLNNFSMIYVISKLIFVQNSKKRLKKTFRWLKQTMNISPNRAEISRSWTAFRRSKYFW